MAIIKTYPLKSNYYGPDRLILSDMQPDAQGVVHGETKNLTLASLKSFIGSGSAPLTLTTTGTSGAATFDVNTNILNVPVYEGDTYNLRALQKSGASVPLKLNAASGTDSEVNFTEGANVTLTRNSDTQITISATGGNAGVSSITNAFGTYITGTNNTAATGAVGFGTINLSAVDGTSDSSTRFLSKDNTWDVISASGSNNQFQYNNNGAFAGSSMLVLGTDEIVIGDTLSEQGKLRIEGSEAASGNIKIEGTTATRGVNLSVQRAISSDYNVIFPDTGPGGNNKILESNSSGELAWVNTPPITSNTGTANYIPKYSSSTALANSAIYDSSSNIGIGTTNPNDGDLTIGTPKLHVAAAGTSGTFNLAARFESTTTDADNTGTSILINSFNDRGLLIKAGRKDGDREVAYFDVVNAVGSTTNMLTMGKFSSVYNVGIGTATPTEKLEVAGNIKTTGGFISTVSSGYSSVELGGPSGAFIDLKGPSTDDYDLRIISGGTGGSFHVRNSSNAPVLAMDIDGDGNVGVGTTNPTTKLDVNGTVNLTNLTVSAAQGTNGQALTSTGSGVGWVTPPQGTITAVSGQSGISGAGTSGPVVLTNSDRGSTAVAALNFFKTIATPTNNVVASGNDATLTLAAGGNTGIFINGSGSQVTIGLYAPTVLDRGGVKLVNATQQSTAANGLTTTAGRTYAIQLNSSGQAVVNVPWSGGSGGGISFSGTTSGGLATFSNSSTAAVSSKVTLNASGLIDLDADGNSAASIDYNPTGNRLQIGDFQSQGAIVELYTNGNKQFQIGVNGEIGLGTGSTQGTNGQVLTSRGNGSSAYWTNKTLLPSNNVTGSGTTYDVPMWNIVPDPQDGTAGSYLGPNTLSGGLAASPFKGNASGQSIISTEVIGGIAFRNGSGQQATINGGTSTGPAYQINLPPSAAASTGKVLGVSGVSSNVISTSWQTAGGGITETIVPWNATLARSDGTSLTETNAAGQLRSDVMVITDNNCFATIQGNVVNYQFYIRGVFKGNTEAGGQYTSITGPLFLARCQNANGSGTVSGIPIQTSQSTTVIDNRFANGSLTVTEDPFATEQSSLVFGSVPNMGTYWKLPIRGGKVGRAYSGSTTLPGFVQLFTSNAAESTNPGKDYSTCVYPSASGDVWYSNTYEYMPEGKGYDFVFAGTITAFVAQST
jgi:hypothetical protein